MASYTHLSVILFSVVQGFPTSPTFPTTKLPGDVGFDPLNIKLISPPLLATKNKDPLSQYREAELKHGRIAMLASIAFPLQESYHAGLADDWNLPNLLEATNGPSPLSADWRVVTATFADVFCLLRRFGEYC